MSSADLKSQAMITSRCIFFLNSASYQRMAGSGLREAGKARAYSTYATADAGEGSAEDAMRSYDADYI